MITDPQPSVGARRHATTPRCVLLVAGEASGDMHGADLVAALRERWPDVEVLGVGGPKLRRAGMRTLVDAAELGSVGVFEAVRGLGRLWRAYRIVRERLRSAPPDLCILIDFPEFNLRVARAARRAGVPIFYYIGPQVWAWRGGRARTIGDAVDRLAVVFPFERALYEPWLSDVHFVGHPLIDRVRPTHGRTETRAAHGLDPERRLVLLLPGSRATELGYMLPPLLDAVRVLWARDPSLHFVVALADSVDAAIVERHLAAAGLDLPVVGDATYDLMAAADLALVTSGTATLECALLECPMVIAYRLSPVTALIGRLLIRGVHHIGMPNIIAGREIVPELIQGEVTGWRLATAARALLYDAARRAATVESLRKVRERLGGGGAAGRAADLAIELGGHGRGRAA
jgi:lipid-A-disaccharide synthase